MIAVKDADGLEVGDEVSFTTRNRPHPTRGTVTKIGKAAAVIMPKNGSEPIRVSYQRAVASETYQRITPRLRPQIFKLEPVDLWLDRRPVLKHVSTARIVAPRTFVIHEESLDSLEEISIELEVLRNWLREEPK